MFKTLVIIYLTLIKSSEGLTPQCVPIESVYDNKTRDICKRSSPWYTQATALPGKDLMTIPDAEINSLSDLSYTCKALYLTLYCNMIAAYCQNSSIPEEPFHTLNPCTSFCKYLSDNCGIKKNTVLKHLCIEYKTDADPVTEMEFKTGSFLNKIFDDRGVVIEGQQDHICIPYYEVKDPSNQSDAKCPHEQRTVTPSYNFLGMKKCGAPCNQILFSEPERSFLRKWTMCWSTLCFLSCFFTFITYLLDRKRFNYPEISIIYLSFCYIFISVAYIAGFFSGNSVSCNSNDVFSDENLVVTASDAAPNTVITQSVSQLGCTVSFAVLYYFTMASSLWWVILCSTWYLTAGLKWSHEAIANKAFLIHAIVWLIPLFLTSAILGVKGIEGDDLTGTCFVGTLNPNFMKIFVLVPLLLFLVIGFAFVLFGLISMCRIRSVIKVTFDSKSADSFEKLMLRIGLFSLFYMVPMAIVVGCYYYEVTQRKSWFTSWQCQNHPKSCPQNENGVTENKMRAEIFNEKNNQNDVRTKNVAPEFAVFVMKYFLNMVVGIASLFWVLSGKTINLWLSVFCACTELGRVSKQKNMAAEAQMEQLGITTNVDLFQNKTFPGGALGKMHTMATTDNNEISNQVINTANLNNNRNIPYPVNKICNPTKFKKNQPECFVWKEFLTRCENRLGSSNLCTLQFQRRTARVDWRWLKTRKQSLLLYSSNAFTVRTYL